MDYEEVDPGVDSEIDDEEIWYTDDPIVDPKIDWFYKLRSFAPVAIVLLVTTIYLPSTVGGGVSLNSGQKIEFGQSVNASVACTNTTNIKIAAYSNFVNALNATGIHYLKTITVSDIPDSCFGADFSISAFGPTSSTPLSIYNTTSTVATIYNKAGTFQPIEGSTGFTLTSKTGSFTIDFTNPVATSASIDKLTVQSSGHQFTCSEGGPICKLGDTGPGGGKVFYVSTNAFACGATLSARCSYLESAPITGASSWTDIAQTSWGSTGFLVGTGTEIGTGARNTSLIGGTAGAAFVARNFRGPNNRTDWHLPSRDELDQLYLQRAIPGGFVSSTYFSSSEFGSSTFYYRHMTNGSSGSGGSKISTSYVRPIRAF